MQDSEYTVRTSKRMQRIIESAIENEIKNKKTFIEDAVTYNIADIVEQVEGSKELTRFYIEP